VHGDLQLTDHVATVFHRVGDLADIGDTVVRCGKEVKDSTVDVPIRARHCHIVPGVFTPVLAKHSKSFSMTMIWLACRDSVVTDVMTGPRVNGTVTPLIGCGCYIHNGDRTLQREVDFSFGRQSMA
jgi:hypothetical protein